MDKFQFLLQLLAQQRQLMEFLRATQDFATELVSAIAKGEDMEEARMQAMTAKLAGVESGLQQAVDDASKV